VNLAAGVSLPESGKDLQQRRMLVFYQENTRARARARSLVSSKEKEKEREGKGWVGPEPCTIFFLAPHVLRGGGWWGGKLSKIPLFEVFVFLGH
jgi:hypothetical protein